MYWKKDNHVQSFQKKIWNSVLKILGKWILLGLEVLVYLVIYPILTDNKIQRK